MDAPELTPHTDTEASEGRVRNVLLLLPRLPAADDPHVRVCPSSRTLPPVHCLGALADHGARDLLCIRVLCGIPDACIHPPGTW